MSDKVYNYSELRNLYKNNTIKSRTTTYELPTGINNHLINIFTSPNKSQNVGFLAPIKKPDLSFTENEIIIKVTKNKNNNINSHRVGIILLDEINKKNDKALKKEFLDVYAQTIQMNNTFKPVDEFKIIKKNPENPSTSSNSPLKVQTPHTNYTSPTLITGEEPQTLNSDSSNGRETTGGKRRQSHKKPNKRRRSRKTRYKRKR